MRLSYPRRTGYFNPRSPHGERPHIHSSLRRAVVFQSTLPARGATRYRLATHPARRISIHAPRTGSDLTCFPKRHDAGRFQSTLPARGATRLFPAECIRCRHFNPRSPHGERLEGVYDAKSAATFQSTLPARGATPPLQQVLPVRFYFNPRSPHGERRALRHLTSENSYFNPRSPHGERLGIFVPTYTDADFNPRSPHGERPNSSFIARHIPAFQSTLPARGATIFSLHT